MRQNTIFAIVIASIACLLVTQSALAQQYKLVNSIPCSEPFSIAVDASGDVFVGSENNTAVQKFAKSGAALGQFGNVMAPAKLAVDQAGNVFVCDFANSEIQKFSNSGQLLGQIGSGTLTDPYSVAVNSSGNLLVLCDTTVHKFAPDGTALTQFNIGVSTNSMATDPSGDIFVADFYGGGIDKFSNVGISLGQFSHGSGYRTGVAVDQFGDVFASAALYNSDRIDMFSNSGAYLTSFGSGQLDSPQGIAVDPSGDVYVADYFNNRVAVFAPVPEPSTLLLMTTGLLSLLAYTWRKRRMA